MLKTFSGEQRLVLRETLTTNNNIAINATAGGGKCHPKDTEILLFNGSVKKVQDIIPGDELMGPDSKPRTVAVTSVGYGKLFNIVPMKGDTWGCNEDHILTLHKNNRHKDNELVDISVKDLLDENWALHPNKNYKQFKLQRTGVDFNEQQLNVLPYLAGLWVGDGTKINGTPNISNIDEEIIDYLKSLNIDGISTTVYQEKTCKKISLTAGKGRSNFIRNEFRRFVDDNKNVIIPQEYLINSRENRLQLLAGLVDSDGHLHHGFFEICTKWESLKNQILFLARSLGFAAYSSVKKLKFNGKDLQYHRISISGDISEVPVKLTRKMAAPRKQIKSVQRTGFRIEENGVGEYYGFTLDGDGRYLLADFTITHNTFILIEIARLLPQSSSANFLAFNKSIVEELADKLPSGFDCMTLHSLGIKALYRHFGSGVTVSEAKYKRMLAKVMEKFKDDIAKKEYNGILYGLCEKWEKRCVTLSLEVPVVAEDAPVEDKIWAAFVAQADKVNKAKPKRGIKFEVSFTDMIFLPVYLNLKMPQWDTVLLDESQDLNNCQHELVNMIIGKSGRLISVGDSEQCQPEGTLVTMADRTQKRIEDIVVGDTVATFSCANGSKYLFNGAVTQVASRFVDEPIIELRSGGKLTQYTGNHKCVVRIKDEPNLYVLYLMQRGNSFRIGKTSWYDNRFLGKRMGQEGCDGLWVLKVSKNKEEIDIDETVYSYQYGIPQLIWNGGGNYTEYQSDMLAKKWAALEERISLRERAVRILTHFNRDIRYPLWKKEKVFKRGNFVTEACNLIPEYMYVNHFNDECNSKDGRQKQGEWMTIDKIELLPYEGKVYSLNIDKHHTYVADGVLTHNCIYGFAGSNPESFKKFAQRPNTVEYPLSVTYRCAKQIVAHARQYSNKIEAHPDAPEGLVREGTLDEVVPGDFILCRNNAPLIAAYFNLLQDDQKAYIVGKDTRDEYIKMTKPFASSHIQALLDHWDNMVDELYNKLQSLGIRRPEKVDSYMLLQEKVHGLGIIASKCSSVKQMIAKIGTIFEPSKDSIILSTIHKAKGLEAHRVYLLRWELMFSKCETPEDMEQERNLAFVAITRAKEELVFIIEPKEEEEEDED
jgi:hypothetical protein